MLNVMQAMNQARNEMLDLYWLAHLLTGSRDASFQAVVDAAELQQEANSFFAKWVLCWSRKIAIAKSLGAIREEIHTSARRTESAALHDDVRLHRGWSLSSETNKVELEPALLAIDVFPRCALVLSILEGLPLDDVATLLNEDRELVKTARAIGLEQLTRRLSASPFARESALPDLSGLQYV
jgi:hypothetical protein